MSLYLGVDLGTQSVKTLIFDAELAKVVARGSYEVPMLAASRPGVAEQNPQSWEVAFEFAMEQALSEIGSARRSIRAMGVSGQQHGMVALDESLQVIRPAKLWCDTEAVFEAEELSRLFGRPVPAGFTAPKILWMKRHEPKNFKRMRQLLLPHDWLNFQLTGLLTTDHGDASGTGLYDPVKRAYDMEGAAKIDAALPTMLPLPFPEQNWIGEIMPELARRFGLSESLRVSPGSGDNMMSALGAGAVRDGTLAISLGTSGTLFGYSSKAVVDPEGGIAAFCDATGGWLPLVCTQNCTTVAEEVSQSSKLSHAELTMLAADVPAGCDDLLFLPYLTGERTPNWPHASGVLHGLRPGAMQPGNLYRSALEGASFALLQGMKRMEDFGMATNDVRLVGGGGQNSLWRQILADMFQVPIRVCPETETAALGAAFQACWLDTGIHPAALYSSFEEAAGSLEVTPDANHQEIYRRSFERYLKLGEQLFRNSDGDLPSSLRKTSPI